MSPTFNPQKPDPSHPTHHTEKPSASGHHNEPSYHHPALSAYRRQSIPSAGSTLDPDIPPDLARQVRRDSMSEVQKESEYIQRHFRQPKMDSPLEYNEQTERWQWKEGWEFPKGGSGEKENGKEGESMDKK